jgi:hypothetical protein
VTPAHPVIGLVPLSNENGYWLIGTDGGVFAFPTSGPNAAPFVGSLPGLGISGYRHRGSGADDAQLTIIQIR